VIPDFHIVRWVEIEERAAACRKMGIEGAALRGWDAARSRGGGSICIEFDGRSVSREILCNLEQCGSIASARIHREERFWRDQDLSEVARFFEWQRIIPEFQSTCITHGSAPFS